MADQFDDHAKRYRKRGTSSPELEPGREKEKILNPQKAGASS